MLHADEQQGVELNAALKKELANLLGAKLCASVG